MLNEVLTSVPIPVSSRYSVRIRWNDGFERSLTIWGRAVPSTCTAAGQLALKASEQSLVMVMNSAV